MMNVSRSTRAVLVSAGVLGCAVALAAQTVLSRVGMSDADARQIFGEAIVGAASPGAAARPFLALAPSARAAVVTEAVAWAKAYVSSAPFKKAWAEKRDENKPDPPALTGSASDDVKKQSADQQKQMQAVVDQMVAQMNETAKDPKYQALMQQGAENNRASKQKEYQNAVASWQHDYPADPNVAIARRLREFLTMSADVNFDAKLVARNGVKTFADPAFEGKPDAWKMCFRAGREATTAARAAAQTWLKELGQ
jgi:hypothetical protein